MWLVYVDNISSQDLLSNQQPIRDSNSLNSSLHLNELLLRDRYAPGPLLALGRQRWNLLAEPTAACNNLLPHNKQTKCSRTWGKRDGYFLDEEVWWVRTFSTGRILKNEEMMIFGWGTGEQEPRERGQQCQRQELHGCRVVLRRHWGPVAGVGASGPRAWEGRQGLDCQRSSVPPALWLRGPGEGFLSWRMAWFDLGCVRRLWGSVEGRAARPQTGQRGPKSGGLDPRLMGSLGPEHVDFRYPVTEGNQTGKKSMA